MNKIAGYIKTIRQYLKTPKGRHDFWDYLKAAIIISLTMLLVFLLLKYLAGAL